jgi:valyl-tRNA synthetase
VKARARDAEGGSAIAALRLGLSVLLRLFAPALPYITEEVWSWAFADETGEASIHRAPWPAADDFAGIDAPADPGCFDVAVACLTAINKAKSEGGVSVGRSVASVTLAAAPATIARLEPVLGDVLASARVASHILEPRAALADGSVEVGDITFALAQEG